MYNNHFSRYLWIVQYLSGQYTHMEKQVLVTSYTNNAVDNVLVKLHQIGVPFKRVCGRDHKLPAEIAGSVLTTEGCASIADLQVNLVLLLMEMRMSRGYCLIMFTLCPMSATVLFFLKSQNEANSLGAY